MTITKLLTFASCAAALLAISEPAQAQNKYVPLPPRGQDQGYYQQQAAPPLADAPQAPAPYADRGDGADGASDQGGYADRGRYAQARPFGDQGDDDADVDTPPRPRYRAPPPQWGDDDQ